MKKLQIVALVLLVVIVVTLCVLGDRALGSLQSGFLGFLSPISRSGRAVKSSIGSLGKDLMTLDQLQAEYDRIQAENRRLRAENNGLRDLKAEILSFIPVTGGPVEVMRVKLTNVMQERIEFTPTAAIPVYGRSSHNIRDHRHVTSLLQRIWLDTFGVIVKPTLLFDESGHKPNQTMYFVLGWDEAGNAPQYIFPTQEMFCGDAGDLEAPVSVRENSFPQTREIQGREAMGALRFERIALEPNESRTYIILMGITADESQLREAAGRFKRLEQVNEAWEKTKEYWGNIGSQVCLSTGDRDRDNWFRWVTIQPVLRRMFGCSFLPDFDYGKGGRGWRDLWQDCLGLILSDPQSVRDLLINNFGGVKIDGSNATIIGKQRGEFIADRNNISRVWMDHGIWPLLTLDVYMQETGDAGILFEETPYFHDHQIFRSRDYNRNWAPKYGNKLKTSAGKVYRGSILEHLLIQMAVQFFNVGDHNHVRLEGADWNDGLDMAKEKGESVAFSALYAHNLNLLADCVVKSGKKKIKVAGEFKHLLKKVDYNSVRAKQKLLDGYFGKVARTVSGEKVSLDTTELVKDLRAKAAWMMEHIRRTEWLKEGFFNGYYDNNGERVEGKKKNGVRMCLASQVFPIMSGTADKGQVEAAFKSAERYLADPKFRGFHLNTDFGEEQHALGRAFSFVYGDKENGAYFNHMAVMFAFGLYKRGYADEGWRVMRSIIDMALDTPTSKIYPCLPEYFNLEGRGMYSYLTGSASWFVLTMLTQVFGVKGRDGDLFIEPKLTREQFTQADTIYITRIFAGRIVKVIFSNPQKLEWGRYTIVKASLSGQDIPVQHGPSLVISRSAVGKLPPNTINEIRITLG